MNYRPSSIQNNLLDIMDSCPDFCRVLYISLLEKNPKNNLYHRRRRPPNKLIHFEYVEKNPEYFYAQGEPATEGIIGKYYEKNNKSYPELLEKLSLGGFLTEHSLLSRNLIQLADDEKYVDHKDKAVPILRFGPAHQDLAVVSFSIELSKNVEKYLELLWEIEKFGVSDDNYKRSNFFSARESQLTDRQQRKRILNYVTAKSEAQGEFSITLDIASIFNPQGFSTDQEYFDISDIGKIDFYKSLHTLHEKSILRIDDVTLDEKYRLSSVDISILNREIPVVLRENGELEYSGKSVKIPSGDCFDVVRLLADAHNDSTKDLVTYEEIRMLLDPDGCMIPNSDKTTFLAEYRRDVHSKITNTLEANPINLQVKNSRNKGYYLWPINDR